jgi:YVTN family beta-propeller protein
MSSDDRMPSIGKPEGAGMTGVALIAGLLALLASTGCGGGSTSAKGGPVAASVRGTIAVGAGPEGIAVDPTTNNIYVVNSPAASFCSYSNGVGVVAWIDGAIDSLAGTSTSLSPFEISEPSSWVTAGPIAVAIDSTTDKAYIAVNGASCRLPDDKPLWGSSIVVAFDLATQAASLVWSPGHVASAFEPGAVGVNVPTGKIYAADDFGSIMVIDMATGSETALTDPGTEPVAIAVNSATNKIYVANFQSSNVTVIDGATNALGTVTDPKAINPTGLAVNETTNTIYVTNSGSNNVTVIDGQTDSIVSSLPVGTFPIAVAVDPQTNFIYVANNGDSQANIPGNVTVINGKTNATTTLTDPKAIGPIAVAANPVTSKIYVANWGSNNVTVIDGAHD